MKNASMYTLSITREAAGKPKLGPIFDKRHSYRLNYMHERIRESQKQSLSFHLNDLHET
jgi:hypothetical protein